MSAKKASVSKALLEQMYVFVHLIGKVTEEYGAPGGGLGNWYKPAKDLVDKFLGNPEAMTEYHRVRARILLRIVLAEIVRIELKGAGSASLVLWRKDLLNLLYPGHERGHHAEMIETLMAEVSSGQQ